MGKSKENIKNTELEGHHPTQSGPCVCACLWVQVWTAMLRRTGNCTLVKVVMGLPFLGEKADARMGCQKGSAENGDPCCVFERVLVSLLSFMVGRHRHWSQPCKCGEGSWAEKTPRVRVPGQEEAACVQGDQGPAGAHEPWVLS